jgi:hypothetical protein
LRGDGCDQHCVASQTFLHSVRLALLGLYAQVGLYAQRSVLDIIALDCSRSLTRLRSNGQFAGFIYGGHETYRMTVNLPQE